MEYYEGQIENIIFHNQENGYTVAKVATPKETITVTGIMPGVYEGENVKVAGEWTYHKNYGRQLKINEYERILPDTLDSIEAYLSSGIFKGIGKKTAARITEKFGEDTLDIIMYFPQRLSEIKGISKRKADELAGEFEQQRELRDITIFLQKHGLGPGFAARVYKEFGNSSIDQITGNPYLLADRIQGIGFRTADRIALNLGIERDSEFRIRSGITYTLFESTRDGHVFLPEGELIDRAERILGVKKEIIKTVFDNFLFHRSIVKEEGRIYLASLFNAEKNSAFKLTELTTLTVEIPLFDIEVYIGEYEKKEKIIFEPEQKQAIINSIRNGTSIITGGPGTGKTTIIKGLIYILRMLDYSYALCAPTGRAAKRMEEATGTEAKTIHRLLEANFIEKTRELEFRRNGMNPLEYDFIIVDEMSMVDIWLFSSLLTAIMPGSRIVMVGDKDQLPSVGPGSVLRDLLKSNVIPYTELRHIFRQDENSLIVYNAHRINKGELPEIANSSSDFFVIQKTQKDIAETIIKIITERLPEAYSFNWREDVCVLTPTRKGDLGVEGLNVKLREVLNPGMAEKREMTHGPFVFREGDRVMQIKNNYGIKWYYYNDIENTGEGLYNGDMGFVDSVDIETGVIEVIFDGEKVAGYERLGYDELEPAFATTIHKSQGSEFNVVIIPLFSAPIILLTRNLLYTALTRARKMAIFVGDVRILKQMVDNVTENKRNTSLDSMLRRFMNDEP